MQGEELGGIEGGVCTGDETVNDGRREGSGGWV